jgi:hypothetical protein
MKTVFMSGNTDAHHSPDNKVVYVSMYAGLSTSFATEFLYCDECNGFLLLPI